MIHVSTNFSVDTALPVDIKMVAIDIATRNSIAYPYNGLICFVESEGTNYQYVSGNWQPLSSSWADRAGSASFADTASYSITNYITQSNITQSTSNYASASLSASWASSSLSASYAMSASSIPADIFVNSVNVGNYSVIIASDGTTEFAGGDVIMYGNTLNMIAGATINATVITASTIKATKITSSLFGTASYAVSASWAPGSVLSASHTFNADTASYISQSIYFPTSQNGYFPFWENNTLSTASFLSASGNSIISSVPITASLQGTASYAVSASWAPSSGGGSSSSVSASYAYSSILAEAADFSLTSVTSITAETSSYLDGNAHLPNNITNSFVYVDGNNNLVSAVYGRKIYWVGGIKHVETI
jgi:hypothetical protein